MTDNTPPPRLTDPYGRTIDYLRLSVTDRCDLRCSYCLPADFHDFQIPEHWLTADELERIVAAFGRLGVSRLRLTGGEPLLRRDLANLASRFAAQPGIEDLSLSTNAVRLAKSAAALRRAGIRRLNVSLDTLNPERYREITGGGKLHKVLDGLEAARQTGFAPIKINMVVMRGINDDEAEAMVDFCHQHQFTLRFIETMPMGQSGQRATVDRYLDLRHIRERLERHHTLLPAAMPGGGPARYLQLAGSDLRIGFITPLSQHFCDSCNRVRLSVDGTLHLCLGQAHTLSLRDPLRAGCSDAELVQQIHRALALKPQRHEFNDKPQQVVRLMSMTGG